MVILSWHHFHVELSISRWREIVLLWLFIFFDPLCKATPVLFFNFMQLKAQDVLFPWSKGTEQKNTKSIRTHKRRASKACSWKQTFLFFSHIVQKTKRKHCSVSVNLIRSMAIKGYIHTWEPETPDDCM